MRYSETLARELLPLRIKADLHDPSCSSRTGQRLLLPSKLEQQLRLALFADWSTSTTG